MRGEMERRRNAVGQRYAFFFLVLVLVLEFAVMDDSNDSSDSTKWKPKKKNNEK
jgi:hypothetical protein